MLNDDIAHISSGWRQKMGINHKDYCSHIVRQKLENDKCGENNVGRQVFKEYLLRQCKKNL
jgi:hypothetical protein